MAKAYAVIPAGGAGIRMGLAEPKQFCDLAGLPIIIHTLKAFLAVDTIQGIILVVPADHLERTGDLLKQHGLENAVQCVIGGKLRQDSVRAGLAEVPSDAIVAVHDGVRPLVQPELIRQCIAEAERSGACIAAVPVKDTLKAVSDEGRISRTVDRSGLWQAQTPQVARVELLRKAFDKADEEGFIGTDEASLLEYAGIAVTVVEGSERNIKITRPEDLNVAESLIRKQSNEVGILDGIRIGQGYDAHRLVDDRPLILGGVNVPHFKGLLGHSDADVLTHALCDAILGAIGAGDIGKHFPDTDQQYKGADSIKLLANVIDLSYQKGYVLVNADMTVIAQKPKLASFIAEMEANIAKACRVSTEVVNIKATTTERMGSLGREEGIAAQAIVLLKKREG